MTCKTIQDKKIKNSKSYGIDLHEASVPGIAESEKSEKMYSNVSRTLKSCHARGKKSLRKSPGKTCIEPTYPSVPVTEKTVERKLVEAVRERGGLCVKMQGTVGIPDRLLLMREGRIAFVELKAPGKKPRKSQLVMHGRIRALGFRVYVIDRVSGIKEVLDEV